MPAGANRNRTTATAATATAPATATPTTEATEATATEDTMTTATATAETPAALPTLSLADLAKGAKDVAIMPKSTRKGTDSLAPLADLIAASKESGLPKELPPVSAEEKSLELLKNTIRRAATSRNLSVTIGHVIDDNGNAVITLQGRAKATR
jgi:hypothetical protein